MIKFIGIFLMLISAFTLQDGFEVSLVLWFLFGLFLVFSQGIFTHIMFIEREKIKAHYRSKK